MSEGVVTDSGSDSRPLVGEGNDGQIEDAVEIRLPADSAYLSVLRTATAGLAARLDFTLDEIEDLRIAVDEACGLLLHDAAPGSSLSCHFAARTDSLVAAVSSQVMTPRGSPRCTCPACSPRP